MRVCVFGATGVLGKALLPLLRQEGYQVRALVRDLTRAQSLAEMGVELVQGDLLSAETEYQLASILSGCDTVVHAATAIPRDFKAQGAWDTNTRLRTEGTRRLLLGCLQAGVEKYVQQSIVMAYVDGGDRWLDESTPPDTSPERASVCAPIIEMEEMVSATPTERLAWCILRGGSFVGAGTAQDALVTRIKNNEEVVPCDGSYFISPVNVADMAQAVALAIKQAPPGGIYNIVDEPIRYGEYIDKIAELIGAPSPPRDPSLPCPLSFRCTNQAARDALGWQPTHSIWPSPTTNP